eukprot:PhF_6_TR36195/c0_g1_i1/m.52775
MELEHALGCTIRAGCCHTFPRTPNKFAFLAGGCVVVSDIMDVHSQALLRGHDDDVTCLAVSSSGSMMCSGQQGRNADVIIWNSETQSTMHRLTEHDGSVIALAFSPDEKLIATVGADRRIIVWDTSNGGIVVHTAVQMMGNEMFTCVAWGGRVQDIKRRDTQEYHFSVATTSRILPFKINPLEATVTAIPLKLSQFTRKVTALVYSNYGDILFAASESGDIAVINSISYTVAEVVPCCNAGVRSLWIAPRFDDGSSQQSSENSSNYQYARFGANQRRFTVLYTGGGDGTIGIYKIDDHNTIQMYRVTGLQMPNGIVSVTGSENPTSGLVQLIVVLQDGNIFAVSVPPTNVSGGTTMSQYSSSPVAPVIVLAAHPTDSTKVLSSTSDGYLRQWDLNSYLTNHTMRYHSAGALCSATMYVRGYEILLCGWSNGNVECYDATNMKKPLWEKDKAHRSALSQVFVGPGARTFVTAGNEGEIRVWDIRTKEMIQEFKEHRLAISGLHAFQDGVNFLSAGKDRFVFLWDQRTARRAMSFEHAMGAINCSALSGNQVNFYTAGMDHRVHMWDIRSKDPVRSIPYADVGGSAVANTIAISGSGNHIALGGTDQVVRLWREHSQEEIRVGVGHSGSVSSVKFTADDRQLVSGGADGCVFVWNLYDEDPVSAN